ncbi:archaetidylserine decarboxylase [Brochothrix campestris]|uniref:phosphatidylserine decarboxylase n=1 Tax=Brochothrix campestris FSL F6-1037 TaxID=1265861 RepID=W7CPK8_9LIST|nr:archaetidylserine decarboxylase [Brochothrix campestris]EUJ38610.1 phosphatidylserine decarboxylase [Brochothrix campestris FSL F6-1037]
MKKVQVMIMRILALRLVSAPLKRFTCSRLSKPLIKLFAKKYRINQAEMTAKVSSYQTLAAFFARPINLKKRPLAATDWVSPVDGFIQQSGIITAEQTFEVKGTTYQLKELLGESVAATVGGGGSFIILYLSPSQYHRYHSPIAGAIRRVGELGRTSFPVNEWGMTNISQLYAKNHRVVYRIGEDTLLVAVGALNINSIVDTFSGKEIEKGAELGYFNFGSTVVILSPAKKIDFSKKKTGDFIAVRSSLGNYKERMIADDENISTTG